MRTPEIVNAATPALSNVTPPQNADVEDVHLPETPPERVGVFPPALSDEALSDGPAVQSTSEVVTVDDAGQVADVTTDHEAVTDVEVAAAEVTPDSTPDVPLVHPATTTDATPAQ